MQNKAKNDWPKTVRFTMDTFDERVFCFFDVTGSVTATVANCGQTPRLPSPHEGTVSTSSAYPIQSSAMRPVTKITILGIRLGVVVLACYWLTLFVGTHLPAVADFSPKVNDKFKHFGAFFMLGTLMCYVTTSTNLLSRFGCIALVGMAYAAIDEFTQSFVPGRYADPYDFVADSAGLISAIAVYALLRFLLRRPDLQEA